MAIHRVLKQAVGGINYLIHPQVLGTISKSLPAEVICPVVLINQQLARQDLNSIIAQLQTFESSDDVYTKAFADTAIIQGSTADSETAAEYESTLTQLFPSMLYSTANSTSEDLPAGPYFLHGSNIHQAWRLYPDELDAFIYGVIPQDVLNPDIFDALTVTGDDGIWKEIAVPSRLYAKPTSERPLAGTRTSLKDIFQLKGVKTTMMSRAFTSLYGPEERSAEYVKKLLKLGAEIIGKTKMTQFASSDEPTDQWIDYHCPFNPRGDMYQSPSGSSAGAAASLAGYDWVDYSIAGDSAGSVRAPATCNGLFSLRPSFNTTSMEGIFVNSPKYDVVGLLTRNLGDLHHLAWSTFDLSNEFKKFPTKILYPLDFFPHSNPKHQEMADSFIATLESFLGTTKVEFSIADRWAKCPPTEAGNKTLKEYLPKSAFWSLCHDYYHEFDGYRARYKEKFGKEAYEGPVAHFRWGLGKSVTKDEYDTYMDELRVFREWFNENVFSTDPDSLSDAIMIMPYGSANPKYRDASNEKPNTSGTIGEKFMSPILHMPQLVLPFGQMPYQSRVSGREEHRPIGSTLMGAKGSDLMLIRLAKEAFETASWPTTIGTGRYMYPLADNVRNVQDAEVPSEGVIARRRETFHL